MKGIGKTFFRRQGIMMLAVALCAGCSNDEDMSPDIPEGFRPVTANSSKWISEVIEYHPAPGQFSNHPLWGTLANASSIKGGEGCVSLGGYGGYIVFKFDHTVPDRDGYDFVIKGNAADGSSEPGAVMVSFDANGNGIADDQWYLLAGEDHSLEGTIKDYEITYFRPSQTESAEEIAWTDNKGASGELADMTFYGYMQSYWPAMSKNVPELRFSGIKLQNRTMQLPNGDYHLGAAGRGYADNYSEDYPLEVNGDQDTRNSNKFDISDAVDAAGNTAALEGIDFIKVYTCVNSSTPNLGEASTEITGAISLAAGR